MGNIHTTGPIEALIVSEAKEFFLKLICNGTKDSCEDMLNTVLLEWYDEQKFRRGQEFSKKNRFLIMNTLLTGVIAVFCDMRSLTILDSTGKSSTPDAAKKRYVSTILHMAGWYENELAPGSDTAKSLDYVRKAHVVNSKAAKLKGIGEIKQFELVLTGFGFFGFNYLRPDLTGVNFTCIEDKEAFIHMWAILNRMIGVHDEYNICLLPLNTIDIIGGMLIRYILIPNIQLEFPLFLRMVHSMLDGLSEFNKSYDYESQMFFCKMLIGVPGYQYNSNFDYELLSKTKILNDNDIAKLNEALKLHMAEYYNPITKHIPIFEDDPNNIGSKRVKKYINYEEEWHNSLGHTNFYKLPFYSKNIIRLNVFCKNLYQYSIGRYCLEALLSSGYAKMNQFNEQNKKKKN